MTKHCRSHDADRLVEWLSAASPWPSILRSASKVWHSRYWFPLFLSAIVDLITSKARMKALNGHFHYRFPCRGRTSVFGHRAYIWRLPKALLIGYSCFPAAARHDSPSSQCHACRRYIYPDHFHFLIGSLAGNNVNSKPHTWLLTWVDDKTLEGTIYHSPYERWRIRWLLLYTSCFYGGWLYFHIDVSIPPSDSFPFQALQLSSGRQMARLCFNQSAK